MVTSLTTGKIVPRSAQFHFVVRQLKVTKLPGSCLVICTLYEIVDTDTKASVSRESEGDNTFVCRIRSASNLKLVPMFIPHPGGLGNLRLQMAFLDHPTKGISINNIEISVLHVTDYDHTTVRWLPRADIFAALYSTCPSTVHPQDPPTLVVTSKNFVYHNNGMCVWCGGRGKYACFECQSVNYCSRECQHKHWINGHRAVCWTNLKLP